MYNSRVTDALEFAINKHSSQIRKFNGQPYITHPMAVAEIVRNTLINNIVDIDPEYLDTMTMVALLHDILEDTDTTIEDLADKFGDRITRMVVSLSNDKAAVKKMGKDDYLSIKINRLDDDELIIKLADRLDNISDLKPASENDDWSNYYAHQTELVFLTFLNHKTYTPPQTSLLNQIKTCLQTRGYI